MFGIDRASKTLLLAHAIMLLGVGLSYAQSAPQQKRYDPPKGIDLTKDLTGAVSSDEFEKFVTTQSAPKPPKINVLKPSITEAIPPKTPAEPPAPSVGPVVQDTISPLSPPPDAPIQYVPYWQESAVRPLFSEQPSAIIQVELEQLIWLSTQYSPRVQSLLLIPQIQRTEIETATGEFDTRRFAKTNYSNNSDPVGNTLTTGGPKRLIDDNWQNSLGLRKRNTLGGKTELMQALNAKDSNSLFFKPNNQADTRLSLNYTQPLLRGAGRYFNTSAIRIAGIKTKGAMATTNRELQNHALDIINTYWDLTLQRYYLIQARQGRELLLRIKEQLLNRSEKDLVSAHLHRVNAAIAMQEGKIHSTSRSLLGLQATLQSLVNAPELKSSVCKEIIPVTIPSLEVPETALDDELCSALLHRWDIIAIQQSIENAMVEKNLATNELKPQLDSFAETYVRGLKGDNDLGRSWTSMFDEGRPSIAGGLEFLSPVGNRSAKSNLLGRELEVRKLLNDYQQAMLRAEAEIVTAIQDSYGTYEMTRAAIQSTHSSLEEVDGYYARAKDFLGETQSISSILNDLVDAQNRLINAENNWALNHIEHIKSIFRIKYESGTLMTITAE